MNRSKAVKILDRLKDHYGKTRADLEYRSTWELTIAVVLSAQTTDKQVNSVTPELFSRYPGPAELASAQQKDVEAIIHPTGFFRNKATNIIALAHKLHHEFNDVVPSSMEELVSLPGVGRKSANVIRSIGFNMPALAVDTHVMRLGNRLGFTASNNPDQVERDITKIIPQERWIETHLLLIRHGRSCCYARKPDCPTCVLKRLCPWEEKTTS